MSAKKRIKKVWWAAVEDQAVCVTGFSCLSPGMWWCPEVGFTLTEKHHLFETEAEAVAKALAAVEFKLTVLQAQLLVLKERTANLKAA